MNNNNSKSENTKTVAVVGLGYVGLPLALLASRKGYKVVGIDIDADRVHAINKKEGTFADATTQGQLEKSAITATTDFGSIEDAGIIVICVPTPVYKNHIPNLEPLTGAAKAVGSELKNGQLVIIE